MIAIIECPVCSGAGEVPPWGPGAEDAPSPVECWHCYGDGEVATGHNACIVCAEPVNVPPAYRGRPAMHGSCNQIVDP